MMRSKTTLVAVLLNAAIATSALATQACLRPVVTPDGTALRGPANVLIGMPGGGDGVLAGTVDGLFRIDAAGTAHLLDGSAGRSSGPAAALPWRDEVVTWVAGEGLVTVNRDGTIRPLRRGPCASPLACHVEAARRMVGPELLDTTERPERLLALPADEHVAVWESGARTTRRISIQKGVPALVRMGPGHPIPVGTPVAVPGSDGLAWLAHDRVFIERPTGHAQVTYVGGAGRPPFEPRAFELPRSWMVLFATERDWIAVRGTSVRSGFAPFNAPPPQITAVSDRGPEGGIWVGLPTGVVHVAFADLLRSRVQTVGRKPSPAATILSASADGDEPAMGAVTALADLADGRLLVGAEGGLFALSRDGAVIGRHRPLTETGQVRRFHRFAAAPGSTGDMRSILVEAQVGLLVVKPDGSVGPVADAAAARGGVAPAPGTSRLFVGAGDGAALLEVVESPRPAVASEGRCRN